MKKTKIIVPALGMLLLSTAASVTGTVAWFSSNAQVTVSGMSVTTKVDSNLLIADADGFANANDDSYTTGPLAQTREGRLLPVSSINGTSFFYHANDHISAVGAATDTTYAAYSEAASLANTDAGKTNYDAAFQTNYGITAAISTSNVIYGYIDYTFYLKATNASDSAAAVKLTQCNLLYNSTALTANDKAWRTGLFVEKVAQGAAGGAVGSLVSILTPASAANFTSGKAVSTTSALGDVTYNAAANIDASLAGGTTQRYKVVVRLWLEGEDNTCNNETYASLTSSYTLGLTIEIGGSNAAVTNIGSVAA